MSKAKKVNNKHTCSFINSSYHIKKKSKLSLKLILIDFFRNISFLIIELFCISIKLEFLNINHDKRIE